VLGLPLGSTEMSAPAAAMVNLLATRSGRAPDGSIERAANGAVIHLYGKRELRPGRKMGHVTAVGATVAEAEEHAREAAEALGL
jgi:5-(carboxyamino)imidazole ribonucleotide synthase